MSDMYESYVCDMYEFGHELCVGLCMTERECVRERERARAGD